MSEGVVLGSATRLSVECCDCGRGRWILPEQLTKAGRISMKTPIADVAKALSCSLCKEVGLPGKSVSVQAYFATDAARRAAEAEVLRNQSVLLTG
jgi:hypothetical protein